MHSGDDEPIPTAGCRLQNVSKTGEHSRAQRIGNKATNFQTVTTKVARHQPVSVFGAARVRLPPPPPLNLLKTKGEILDAGTVPGVSTKRHDHSPEIALTERQVGPHFTSVMSGFPMSASWNRNRLTAKLGMARGIHC